ncbi:MAG TPA: J domain-containing protein [Roseateles sp.]
MWEEDWALLGIEPTTELAAIKKAYALKLRATRPDDDAEAYQALRAAYERVQQWVKWQRENPAGTTPPAPATVAVHEHPAPSPPPEQPEPEPERERESEPAPEHVVQPQHLIDELELRWRRDGEAALMFGWRKALRELDEQPLYRQAEFSVAFAQWVLQLQNLPDDFLKALAHHFGWLHDFRAERQLGPALAHALHQALDGRVRPRVIDPAVKKLASPLLALDARRKAGMGWWQLQWLLFLLQPPLTRACALLGGPLLHEVGLGLEAQRWLAQGFKRGLQLRASAVAALCFGAGLAAFGDPIIAGAHTLYWLAGTGLVMAFGLVAGALISVGTTGKTPSRRITSVLERLRNRRGQPLVGLFWLLLAAGLASFDTPEFPSWQHFPPNDLIMAWLYLVLAWVFGAVGLLGAWPLTPLAGPVLAGLAPLVGYLFLSALGDWMPLPSCLLLGAVWMLLAAAVHEGRLRFGTPLLWPLRPLLNSLALAQRWGYSVALLPLATCTAWAVLNDGHVRPFSVFVVWVLGILATAGLQARADTLGLRLLPLADAG